jgi:hypothetical protein
MVAAHAAGQSGSEPSGEAGAAVAEAACYPAVEPPASAQAPAPPPAAWEGGALRDGSGGGVGELAVGITGGLEEGGGGAEEEEEEHYPDVFGTAGPARSPSEVDAPPAAAVVAWQLPVLAAPWAAGGASGGGGSHRYSDSGSEEGGGGGGQVGGDRDCLASALDLQDLAARLGAEVVTASDGGGGGGDEGLYPSVFVP